MKEIENMTIRGQDGTCVVLHARPRITYVKEGEPAKPLTLKLARIAVSYEDGTKCEFYIEEDTLIQFIRESLNAQDYRYANGLMGGKI